VCRCGASDSEAVGMDGVTLHGQQAKTSRSAAATTTTVFVLGDTPHSVRGKCGMLTDTHSFNNPGI